MTNLITKKQKKVNKIDYVIRLISISLFIASLLGIFLLAYIIPYYISVGKKDLKVAEQFKSVINTENKENVGESVTQIVNQTLDELKAIEGYSSAELKTSAYFAKIVTSKNPNISLNKLSFGGLRSGQASFLVSGISQNRDGLVSFIEDLKTKGGFSSVESPISDFAKDRDIVFTLNIQTNI